MCSIYMRTVVERVRACLSVYVSVCVCVCVSFHETQIRIFYNKNVCLFNVENGVCFCRSLLHDA